MAPGEEFLKEQIDRTKRDVEADLTDLRSELATLQRKVAMALAVAAVVFVLFKVGRAVWRRGRD